MELAILLSLAASFCTATSSVCQRLGARHLESNGHQVHGFDPWLVFRLARQPVWLLGFAAMLGGFVLQVSALHFGPLALVQPILAIELLFVFGYLAVRDRQHHVRVRDWMAAAGMAAGLAVFLYLADPSGGSAAQATAWHWIISAAATYGAVAVVAAVAMMPLGRRPHSGARRAALLAVSAGIAFGFVAAVVKEVASHVSQGPYALFTNWSPYVLVLTGAVAIFLGSNAFHAGPLAATQPGLTLVDPLVASLLGITVFGEHLSAAASHLTLEAVAGVVLVGSVILLSRSPLIQEVRPRAEAPAEARSPAVGRPRLGAAVGPDPPSAPSAPPSPPAPPGQPCPEPGGRE